MTSDITAPETNVRTSVHEYGGAAWWAADGVAFYTDFADQRLRWIEPGNEPVLLTAEPATPRSLRYADGRPTPDGDWFVCVHERHGEGEPVNEIVAVATDGSMRTEVIATGADFVASPRMSPDGRSIVWIQWMHPNMPWDSTELWIADLDGASASNARKLVGNGDEAVQEPLWWSDGTLVVVTDRDEWWNLYRVDLTTGDLTPEAVGPFEIVEPHWVFGGARHGEGAHVLGDRHGDRISASTSICPTRRSGRCDERADAYTFVASSYTSEQRGRPALRRRRRDPARRERPRTRPRVPPEPELVTFPTSGDDVAHGVYYVPGPSRRRLPEGERPP